MIEKNSEDSAVNFPTSNNTRIIPDIKVQIKGLAGLPIILKSILTCYITFRFFTGYSHDDCNQVLIVF